MLLAIDPGPTESAWVELRAGEPVDFAKEPNEIVLRRIRDTTADLLAVEMIASYGMPVGREVFETCVWVGRFVQRWEEYGPGRRARLVRRLEAKTHLCHSAKANDANVRAALIDRWGGVEGKAKAIGLKATPGPLYGVTGDVWAALAVAVTVSDTRDDASEAAA